MSTCMSMLTCTSCSKTTMWSLPLTIELLDEWFDLNGKHNDGGGDKPLCNLGNE